MSMTTATTLARYQAASRDKAHALPTKVITLDMDGTMFDPYACCGRKDHTYVGTANCRHLRADTAAKVQALQEAHAGCRLVVLSWRSGMEKVTREWLDHVGIKVTHVFIPNGADTTKLGAKDAGQVGFKVNVARALMAAGVEIVGAFEDNPDVVAGLQAVGVPAERVEHLVEVHAGRLGPLNDSDWYNNQLPLEELDWDACNRMPSRRISGSKKLQRA